MTVPFETVEKKSVKGKFEEKKKEIRRRVNVDGFRRIRSIKEALMNGISKNIIVAT